MMSTAKRSRQRQRDAPSASPPPATKRIKTTTSHVPARNGLGFLVDEHARAGRRLDARLTNGVPSSKSTRVDESHALVAPDTRDNKLTAKGPPREVIDISSAEEESSAYEEGDDEDDEARGAVRPVTVANGVAPVVNGHEAGDDDDEDDQADAELGAEDDRDDEEMDDGQEPEAAAEVEAEAGEPSFGDMLQIQQQSYIDVQASFEDPSAARSALVPTSESRGLVAPTGTSLGHVLTQALKTNDKDMLESCFQTTDKATISATVRRLQPEYALTLISRLAERIHKRPGRTGKLMVWVQWVLVTHGGYLVTQPEMMQKIRSLAQVVRERASGLQPLLHLKGKLDMLSAQLDLRKDMRNASRAANPSDEENEEAVLYVEGQDADDWSEDEQDIAMQDGSEQRLLEAPIPSVKGQTGTPRSGIPSSEEDEDESGDGLLPNGIAHDSEEDEEEDEEDEVAAQGQEGMFDEEAEEASDEDEEPSSNGEEESDPESEDDTDPSEDESEPEIKPPQPQTLNRRR